MHTRHLDVCVVHFHQLPKKPLHGAFNFQPTKMTMTKMMLMMMMMMMIRIPVQYLDATNGYIGEGVGMGVG